MRGCVRACCSVMLHLHASVMLIEWCDVSRVFSCEGLVDACCACTRTTRARFFFFDMSVAFAGMMR